METQKWNIIQDNRPVLTQRTREQALSYIDHFYSSFTQAAVHLWELRENEQLISQVKLEKAN